MTRQRTSIQTLKSLAGSVLVAPGLSLLLGNVDGVAARLNHLLSAMPGEGLGILSSIILAASLNPHRLLHALLQMFWPPLLLILAGSVLLWDASAGESRAWPASGKCS